MESQITSTSILETRKTRTSPALTIGNLYSYDLMEKTKAKAYQIMDFNLDNFGDIYIFLKKVSKSGKPYPSAYQDI
ncbi:hypothetical protein APICC_03912 [Apis cerana cerana]|uniref:Uncharacterized protein n=1 Tax=Apis cerana cerana TaxID=94128 RepID=A0A2A3E9J2_APICC|nr:hypothetical protein APICC_03912 [Apis cerana cerana]